MNINQSDSGNAQGADLSALSSDKVSIIIPAYNAAKLIGQTLDSVLAQTHADWEVIVVDDKSKDATREVVLAAAKNDPRIQLMPLSQNCGAPAAPRNKGVAAATGKWIAFLDADDIWHPQKLELQIAALRKHNGYFACSQMRDFRNAADIKNDEPSAREPQEITFAMQRIKGRIPNSSVILDAATARAFPFNEDMAYKAVEDYHCWLRILQKHGPCLKLASPLLHYRRIEGQISGSKTYMLGRMFHLHSNFPGTPKAMAPLFAFTHLGGAAYYRLIKGEL